MLSRASETGRFAGSCLLRRCADDCKRRPSLTTDPSGSRGPEPSSDTWQVLEMCERRPAGMCRLMLSHEKKRNSWIDVDPIQGTEDRLCGSSEVFCCWLASWPT